MRAFSSKTRYFYELDQSRAAARGEARAFCARDGYRWSATIYGQYALRCHLLFIETIG
jgi:hypothetical protein